MLLYRNIHTTHQQIMSVLITYLFLRRRSTCLLNAVVLTVNKCFFVVIHNTVACVTLSNIKFVLIFVNISMFIEL